MGKVPFWCHGRKVRTVRGVCGGRMRLVACVSCASNIRTERHRTQGAPVEICRVAQHIEQKSVGRETGGRAVKSRLEAPAGAMKSPYGDWNWASGMPMVGGRCCRGYCRNCCRERAVWSEMRLPVQVAPEFLEIRLHAWWLPFCRKRCRNCCRCGGCVGWASWWGDSFLVMVGMHVAVRSPLADRVIQMSLWNISFNLSRVNRVSEVSLRSAAVGER